MSGYLSRLMHQTGIVVSESAAPAPPSPGGAPALQGALSPPAGIETDEVAVVDAREAASRTGIDQEPCASANQAEAASSAEGIVEESIQTIVPPDVEEVAAPQQPAAETPAPLGDDRVSLFLEKTDLIPARSVETPARRSARSVDECERFEARSEPNIGPVVPGSARETVRSYGDVLRTVRAWVADPPEPVQTDESWPDVSAGPPQTGSMRAQTAGADALRASAAEPLAHAVTPVAELSLSIGTISVTIEAPALAPPPLPAAPRRTEWGRDVGVSDPLRFRRHYLRR